MFSLIELIELKVIIKGELRNQYFTDEDKAVIGAILEEIQIEIDKYKGNFKS